MTQPTPYRAKESLLRLKISIRGAVQGVGFRPFVYRLASEMNVPGWVSNTVQGVFIEVEGSKETLDRFLLRVQEDKPPRSSIQSLEFSFLDPLGFTSFEIRESAEIGPKTALVLPDISMCADCRAEILDPKNRRYLYSFTNCTNCGPRFSIIEALPYDRSNTSMKRFPMCPECQKEYDDPANRRFHAQPIACPNCGPHLELWDEEGKCQSRDHDSLLAAAKAIREGKIVAVKGLGGFHLMVDARSEEGVQRLRARKHREEKPFALLFPSIEMIEEECSVSDLEKRLLLSPESPIVLLERKDNRELYGKLVSTLDIAASIAPGNPFLGIMLPYTPLHQLLMNELGHPVVATSGNISDEPICIDEQDALDRLSGIADKFLVHDRPIVRHIDDSIVRIVLGRELVMRRARGYAPLPIQLFGDDGGTILALGAHLKNTVAIAVGSNAFISQHIGDLETQQSLDAFRSVRRDLERMYDVKPSVVVCDLHPEYFSSKEAHTLNQKPIEVQHHYAHVLSCMAENQLEGQVLGVSWDGTGYGTDGTIWGGEFLKSNGSQFERFAAFKTFPLPGGEKAIKEPRRTAVGLLYELFGADILQQRDRSPFSAFTVAELSIVGQMLKRGVNAPRTSSVGRLFDAVASMIGLRQRNSFEGQAAMELEFALARESSEEMYRCAVATDGGDSLATGRSAEDTGMQRPLVVDWSQMVQDVWTDAKTTAPTSLISKKFHNTLVEVIVDVARHAGIERVVLTGGCFQNKYLTEQAVERLRISGFQPYWHQRVPPNDGGISLGQIYAARMMGAGEITSDKEQTEEAAR